MIKSIFREKVIIITGASYGIGRQLALQLADHGAWLALAARSVEKLEEVSKQCTQRGGRVITVSTDVSDQSQCKNLIERTVKEYGRIDILINNAGIGMAARFEELEDLSLYEKIIKVNFLGGVYCTHYALPYLKESKGQLVAVSSLRGKFASGTADGYPASKHAMAGFYDSLRNELSDSGINVTTIYPGWVSTGISSRSLKPDGTQKGEISRHEKKAMPVEKCAKIIIKAVTKRKREVIMTFMGKLGLWLKVLAPKLVDRMSRKRTK
ncbi:MAG: SDR family oxidoreductase [Candidatus Marinimicrobia bacterium]|nr:SDR family oxidoreductase [Candidatus Neomarinimicrobiota bacterium]